MALYRVTNTFRWSLSNRGMTVVYRFSGRKHWFSLETLRDYNPDFMNLFFFSTPSYGEEWILDITYSIKPDRITKEKKP